jgi:hypothetical protein
MARWTCRGDSGGWARGWAPLGVEAVQQQAQVPLPGVGGAGGADGRRDAGVGPVEERWVFEGEVGAELPALLGAVDL